MKILRFFSIFVIFFTLTGGALAAIIYNTHGGTLTGTCPTIHTGEISMTIAGCTATRANSTFAGWCLNAATCTNTITDVPAASSDVTLHAQWTCNAGYTASGDSCVTTTSSNNCTDPNAIAAGYTSAFRGFGVDERCFKECDASCESYPNDVDVYGINLYPVGDHSIGGLGKMISFFGDTHIDDTITNNFDTCANPPKYCAAYYNNFSDFTNPDSYIDVNFWADTDKTQLLGTRKIQRVQASNGATGYLWFTAGSAELANNGQLYAITYPSDTAPIPGNLSPTNTTYWGRDKRQYTTEYVTNARLDSYNYNNTNASSNSKVLYDRYYASQSETGSSGNNVIDLYLRGNTTASFFCNQTMNNLIDNITNLYTGTSFDITGITTAAERSCAEATNGYTISDWIIECEMANLSDEQQAEAGEEEGIEIPGIDDQQPYIMPYDTTSWPCLGDANVYAEWSSPYRYISYQNMINATASATGMPTTYLPGTAVKVYGVPTRANSTFAGWCTNSTLTSCAMMQTIPATETGNKT